MQSKTGGVEPGSGGPGGIAFRTGIALAFFMLGLASLKAWASIDAWFCSGFADACRHASKCPGGLDQCPDNWLAALVFLGPEFAFSIAAFVYARRRHGLVAWFTFAAALLAVHGSMMILSRLVHS